MLFGATYSHRHIHKLGMNHSEAFDYLLNMKFDLIRVCCYWDETHLQKNKFNFQELHDILQRCENNKQKVIFAFGMKTPRSPEFYIPHWTQTDSPIKVEEYLFQYLKKVVKEFKEYSSIYTWQVENEPLDPSGPRWLTIPYELLEKEVEYIRNIDRTRPITLTLWGNELSKRKLFSKIESIGDIIGLDLYYKQPMEHLGTTIFRGPTDSNSYLRSTINKSTKHVWITELQAEPWGQKNPTSASNKEFLCHNFNNALELNAEAIIFWGYEYWYKQKTIGDNTMLTTIQEMISQTRE